MIHHVYTKKDEGQFALQFFYFLNPDQITVHACDIWNPTMKLNNYRNWSYLLTQEFIDQTIKEAKIWVDVTRFLIYKDKLSYYEGQIFFSKSLVLLLWIQLGELYPELKDLLDKINKNLEILQQKLKRQCHTHYYSNLIIIYIREITSFQNFIKYIRNYYKM